ncbi:general amino acid permease AGP2 [Podospora australis]|uniref:General amino acid permease AGP2 n=1 Tax=Podospora australis TaxID=1536484 RepID=A0AAN6WZG1_9PEZI|nr:general amino acid permease AGP2 [Podospora australis]
MASKSDAGGASLRHQRSPDIPSDGEKGIIAGDSIQDASPETGSLSSKMDDHTHRKLKSRHIQLIGIGGTIGTALYVQIGKGLLNGGPGSLFLAFTIWCTFILAVTLSTAELVTYLPISSPFIRLAGRYVDEAFGFAAGWNFFIFEAALVPFEIVACNVIIHYWSDAVPAGGIIAIILVAYALINVLAVQFYGEVEFWAALGKVLLIIALLIFTFIVMLGGNPLHDRFGFRYWSDPGAFASLPGQPDSSLGKFMGFLQCLILASFSVSGPDYVAMAAGEAENPRKVMPRAFNAVFYRLTTFFMLGSLAVGILVPHNDELMATAFSSGAPGAAASPYVIAMDRLRINVLPDIVNAMVLTAAFSAGNSYVYCASRSLYGLALEGKAPKVFTKCTKKGVPIYCVLAVLIISLLSFLQVSNAAAVVLSWFVSLVTASQLINFSVMCVTYLRFHYACKAQGLSRDSLPYKSILQPYAAWYGLAGTFVMTFVGGYTVFLEGGWDVPTFLFSYVFLLPLHRLPLRIRQPHTCVLLPCPVYLTLRKREEKVTDKRSGDTRYTMIFICPVLYLGWKFIKKTKIYALDEVDLFKNVDEIEEYQKTFVAVPPKNWFERALDWLFG